MPATSPDPAPLPPERLQEISLSVVSALRRREESFFARPRGREDGQQRAQLADQITREMFAAWFANQPGVSLAAVGGFGRGELFPSSDIDLLFFCPRQPDAALKARLRGFLQSLWDVHLRVSHGVRSPEECGELHEGNTEFTIGLLDMRPLAGEPELYERARLSLSRLLQKKAPLVQQRLEELIRERHARFADTVFHLEPNVKESPGGLRDLHAVGWLRALEWTGDGICPAEARMPATPEWREAHENLALIRTFLHYVQGRDVNLLSYELQERLGRELAPRHQPHSAEAWMRAYFRHARLIARELRQRMAGRDAGRISARRLSTAPGWKLEARQVDWTRPMVELDYAAICRGFLFAADAGAYLSPASESAVQQALIWGDRRPESQREIWPALADLLRHPLAYEALAEMHQVGILSLLLPEFSAVDGWVQRDFHHRYTVDEHTLLTLRGLRLLQSSESPSRQRLAELYGEIEKPELLSLALLLHDLAKPAGTETHVAAGAEQAAAIAARWSMDAKAAADVVFLVGHHLAISKAMRRDIFDPDNISALALELGNEERLKMLTLMTWADIHAVHPEAMTAWKEENLFQLYIETYNALTHRADQNRIVPGNRDVHDVLAQVSAGELRQAQASPEEFAAFLEGLPRRYLASYSAQEMLRHLRQASGLARQPVQTNLVAWAEGYELTVIMRDRPGIFVTLTGLLAGRGFNIVKAEAVSNRQGIVVDRFRFLDPSRSLELNPEEYETLQRQIVTALSASYDPERLRLPAQHWFARGAGPAIAPRVHFEATVDGKQTLLEVITRDRPGLLFDISRILAQHGCDLSVALIDTESTKAIDVFYLTFDHRPLDQERILNLRKLLLEVL